MIASQHPVDSAKESKVERNADRVDVVLDVSAVILGTLRDVAHLSPVPGLSEAAGIAVSIAGIVAKARNNKDDFRRLAEDSTELVYAIVRAHKDVTRPEDVPSDLIDNLRQLVTTLTLVHKFAEKGARRNFFMAMIRSNVDATRILDYREKLRQSMRVFGLQSDISLRDTVHKLAEQQVEMMNELKNREGRARDEPGSTSPASISPVPSKLAPLINSAQGQVKVSSVSGDKITNKASTTTTNTNSYNDRTKLEQAG
ncbi:hypothetical protein JOM56_000029 [Amanita muscaria]